MQRTIKEGRDPDDRLFELDETRDRLQGMGEEITDELFDDTILLALTDDFEFIRWLHHRDRSFGVAERS